MRSCKKYKSRQSLENHHPPTKTDCTGCVYFSKFNCGAHAQHSAELI